jgi:hypothetical protein
MILINDDNLIGDALGTIPVTIYLSQQPENRPFSVKAANKAIAKMIPKKYEINFIEEIPKDNTDRIISLSGPHAYGGFHNLHMTQAHFTYLNLPRPPKPIRPEIELEPEDKPIPEFDFILAPHSNCLPDNQRWPLENWVKLTERFPNNSFVVMGSTNPPNNNQLFEEKNNLTNLYNQSLNFVSHVMKKARYGLVSVVTGISHLSFALDVPNVLLSVQQEAWGINPDSSIITSANKDIRDITIPQVEVAIRSRFNIGSTSN